jgi:cytoskeleton protein RodZ
VVGEFLRDRRKNLKIEIADVSSYLKVKPHDIEAIENNDFEKVTRHLYVPGLIRSYAKFLKIDPQIIEENIKLLPVKSNVENKNHQLLNIGENIELTPTKDSVFNFFLVSVLLFLVLLSLYNSYEDKSNLITDQNLISELGVIK